MIWYFIFGIIFSVFVYPLLDAVVVLIATWIELGKGKISVKLAECQKKVDEIYPEEKEEKAPAIGFVYPDVYEEEYYEEEEEEEEE